MNEKSTIHTHQEQVDKAYVTTEKVRNRFSLRKKLILIFGILIAAAGIIEIVFAVVIARKAVTEKIEAHLIDKANDTAEIINGRVTSLLQFVVITVYRRDFPYADSSRCKFFICRKIKLSRKRSSL